ncbi:MAG: hypothetical protein J6C96_10995 [Oscillospiraceae bacterium]|nr:hypothetical protein [Oscillospiraceae bacterium]
MDKERFYNALNTVLSGEHIRAGIGTYGEKTVHAVLKNYFEPYADSHEQKIGGYVADIIGEDGIIEIQTAGFDHLRKKLEAFLSVSRVTVVHPIPRQKWIIPIDPETGERGRKRKSPVKGTPYDIFPELYKIKPFLSHENFRLCIVMLDVEEYRRPPEESGLKRGRRRGYVRYDRVPLELAEKIHIDSVADWEYFIPKGLPEEFISKEFGALSGVGAKYASLVLNVLTAAGAVEKTGKRGNSILYKNIINL